MALFLKWSSFTLFPFLTTCQHVGLTEHLGKGISGNLKFHVTLCHIMLSGGKTNAFFLLLESFVSELTHDFVKKR